MRWKEVSAVFAVGVLLFLIQIAGLCAWLLWSFYQLSQPVASSMNNINAQLVLTSIYPFVGSPTVMIPILEELHSHCTVGVCTVQNKYIWVVTPLISAPVYFILFGATYKLYPEERGATTVMAWNASALLLTAFWTGWAFFFVRGKRTGPTASDASGVDPMYVSLVDRTGGSQPFTKMKL